MPQKSGGHKGACELSGAAFGGGRKGGGYFFFPSGLGLSLFASFRTVVGYVNLALQSLVN